MEAIRFLAGRLARLLWLFNDILYRGQLPPKLDEGLAVLLPKARSPCPHQRNATVDVERQLSAVATEQWMQVAGDRPQCTGCKTNLSRNGTSRGHRANSPSLTTLEQERGPDNARRAKAKGASRPSWRNVPVKGVSTKPGWQKLPAARESAQGGQQNYWSFGTASVLYFPSRLHFLLPLSDIQISWRKLRVRRPPQAQ